MDAIYLGRPMQHHASASPGIIYDHSADIGTANLQRLEVSEKPHGNPCLAEIQCDIWTAAACPALPCPAHPHMPCKLQAPNTLESRITYPTNYAPKGKNSSHQPINTHRNLLDLFPPPPTSCISPASN
ncbi:hypothetical protein ACLOJK_005518 [Asimina triloba]